MARLREPGRERLMGADNIDAATLRTAEGSVAAALNSRSSENTAVSAQTSNEPAPGATTLAEVTADNMIRELDEARLLALRRGQASAAVTAILANARLAGLLNERGESSAESAKFDGNYVEAARRISLLLRLANHQTARGHTR